MSKLSQIVADIQDDIIAGVSSIRDLMLEYGVSEEFVLQVIHSMELDDERTI
jgi:hypothetical protein